MPDKSTRRSGSRALWLCLLLPLSLLASGCKEEFGKLDITSASTAEASESSVRPTLRWEPPASREDGSRLYAGDIKEYRIYYRLRHQSEFKAISRPTGKGTSFALDQFRPGAYEFSVTAVDTEGRESRRSGGVTVNLI